MKTIFSERPAAVVRDLVLLSSVLFKLEASREHFDADQYRNLAAQIKATLKITPPGPQIETVLKTFPATASIYDNLQDEHAGLCMVSLENSVSTEGHAAAAIARAMKRTTA